MILAKTISNRQGGPINYFSAEKKNQITTFWLILIEWENIHITHGINDTFRSCKSA